MIRFLWSIAVSLISSVLGLLIAAWLIPGVSLSVSGFIIAVIVFTIAQGILGPFVFNVARQYASAILGGIGLVTTLISLFIASIFPGGLRIDGVLAWVLAPLVVWIVTALGGWILGYFLIKRRFGDKAEKRRKG
ncbi:phage holin family protein [Plantibacter flavus]|uniref:phage holin family protein n=1 Tax=Plantibacter flavus TaxID=150123 RepID=UPI003F156443